MARILYCVGGEGMGHAIRSQPVIKHLSKEHQVITLSYSRAYVYLNKHFKNVYDIKGFHFIYEDNRLAFLKTFGDGIKRLPKLLRSNIRRFSKIFKGFKPDLVITDLEPSSTFMSLFFQVPLISVDNPHVISKCNVECPKKYRKTLMLASSSMGFLYPGIKYYLITTFFFPPVRNRKNTFVFPPILRDKILRAKTSEKSHVVVYQTSQSYGELFSILKKINNKFVVYGFDKNKKDGNLVFKKFSESGFIKDLASCKAIITNGGFTLISEAVYLKKPILSVPVRQQTEQIVNAHYVDKLGYGEYHEHLSSDIVKNFIKNVSKCKKNIRKHKQQGNKKLFEKLDKIIQELT